MNSTKLLTNLSLLFILTIATLFISHNVIAKQNRVALVIGNADYKFSPLKNPVNDAESMSSLLSDMGFIVIKGTNLGRKEMRTKIREFGNRIRSAKSALFYFAGHGMQLDGNNYLIPIKANIEVEDEIIDESINTSAVLRKMETAGADVNIVILDACRNNPFKRSFRSSSSGLAKIDGPKGSLIAYATAPGSVAADGTNNNGLYTEQLIKYMQEPIPLEKVFKKVRIAVSNATGDKQIPWENSSLVGEDFYFNKNSNIKRTNSTPIQQAKVVTVKKEHSVETQFWKDVNSDPSKEMYEAYLEEYPNGLYVRIAKIKLKKIIEAIKTANIKKSIRAINSEESTNYDAESRLSNVSVEDRIPKNNSQRYDTNSVRVKKPIENTIKKVKYKKKFGLIYDKEGKNAFIKTEESRKLQFSLSEPFNIGDRVKLYISKGVTHKVEVVK